MNALQLAEYIRAGKADAKLNALYGKNLDRQRKRYADAAEKFASLYGAEKDAFFFSVPGRSEISGNHTDHNRGKVLAGAIDLDIIAVASRTDDGAVRVRSEGYSEDRVELSDISEPKKENFFKSRGLLAGVLAG